MELGIHAVQKSAATAALGYEPKFAAPPGYDRPTSRSRRSKSNVCFFGFLSAAPPGADAQDGGANSPNLTPSRSWSRSV